MGIGRRRKYRRHGQRLGINSNNENGGDPPSPPPTHNPHLPPQPPSPASSATESSPHPSPAQPIQSSINPPPLRSEKDDIMWRQMITGYYRLLLGSPPETTYRKGDRFQGWDGDDGVITNIMTTFSLEGVTEKLRIRKVLETVTEWSSRGILYEGQRTKGQGRKPLINSPQEYQILIDSMEQGYGLVTAMHQINEYREEEIMPEIGLTTVRRTMNRLGPVLRKVKRRKQGNKDPTSPWAKARLRWATQLLVRLGEHEFDCTADENKYLGLTNTPAFFDRAKMPPLSVNQLVFFDECHKKTEIGRTGETVYSFPRDDDGLYDNEGSIADVETKLHVKYAKEGRFSFGVAAVALLDGTIEGRRCKTFDYSAKNLITITAEEKMIKEEIRRVRNLQTGGQWVVKKDRSPGTLWENDCITTMSNIADTTKAKFEAHGIHTVLDMKMMTDTEVSAIVGDKGFRVSVNTIKKWQQLAEQASEGSAPSRVTTDHRKDENPYLSRYGCDRWMEEIRKCTAMSSSICVTQMIHHMVDETERVMKGTKYEGQGQFYHDALTLMTCKKSKAYMQQHNLLKYWLLPLENLQAGTRYHDSIPGDSPELMPLDETLNQDIHSTARYHVAITSHLPKDDPRKFSFSTPKEISRAYLRLVDRHTGGAPSSRRIIQDCEKWVRSLGKIRRAGGKIVEGFGRNGHRESSHGKKRGGYQPKKARGPGKWVHNDAHGLTEKMWRDSILKIDNKQMCINTPSSRSSNTPSTLDSSATTSSTLSTTKSAKARTPPDSEQGQTSETPSPLTMLYFSDLETEENVSRKRNNIMMHSDDEDMDIGQEENDYELLDEEVMSVLLGLTENMALE
jgi:transposase